jgi:ribosome biogenesis GTPase / thiamine phosphate phosphatase
VTEAHPLTGRVLEKAGGVYRVETATGVVDASLRGRMKREERSTDRVVIGDQVELETSEGDVFSIARVAERRSALVRRAPGKAPRPKPIVANVDRVVVVFAAARPEPNLRMLDRFLVIAEHSGLPAVVVVNKVETVPRRELETHFASYPAAGYPLLFTSAKTGEGVEELREMVSSGISVLTGPSGVGKSSLANVIEPGLGLRVGEVGVKGRHTTVTARLIRLRAGGYLADTPGLREVGLWEIPPEELDKCFPEFEEHRAECRFAGSCSHTHEPGCGVLEAVERGEIDPGRYESYRLLHAGDEETNPGRM